MGIRYLILVGAFCAAFGIPVVGAYIIVSDPLSVMGWFFVALGFRAWQEQGGFSGFSFGNMKKFLEKAKEAGL